MLAYLVRPLLLLAALAGATTGCAAPKPDVHVIGVSDDGARASTPALLVFIEVTNPTGRHILLSRLEYQFDAEPWFATEGRLAIARSLSPGGSTVLEIPVRLDALERLAGVTSDVGYRFDGRLFAEDGDRRTDWRVRVNGALTPRDTPQRAAGLALPQPRRD
jgi:hypothetical protein